METEKSLYPYLVEYMYVHICMYEWEVDLYNTHV